MLKISISKNVLCQMMKTVYKHCKQCSDKFLWKYNYPFLKYKQRNTKMESLTKKSPKLRWSITFFYNQLFLDGICMQSFQKINLPSQVLYFLSFNHRRRFWMISFTSFLILSMYLFLANVPVLYPKRQSKVFWCFQGV